jgi:hypothetical protein
VLSATYLLRQLPPWFANIAKRQYKAPKVYVRDSGLLHALLAIQDFADLESHPKLGASWEGFALEQVLAVIGRGEAFYWGTHAGAELDLLVFRHGRRYGIEFKYGAAPSMTKSLHIALGDLELERVWIVYPGRQHYPVHTKVDVLPLTSVATELAMLDGTPRSASRRRSPPR